MQQPLCPSCSERMSSTERGFGGVWSCLYCEGVWLPAEQVRSLLLPGSAPPLEVSSVPSAESQFTCPFCSRSLVRTQAQPEACVCPSCCGVFLGKGLLQALAPQAASSNMEAPVVSVLAGTLASLFALDPMPLVAALQRRSGNNVP